MARPTFATHRQRREARADWNLEDAEEKANGEPNLLQNLVSPDGIEPSTL
jgi:hypothetical protein